MPCPLCAVADRIRSGLREDPHPSFIAELSETYAVLGENQGSRGWCVLILKQHADHVASLDLPRQLRLWRDVARTAAAQQRVFGPVRINYECLGNQVPHVHWHIIPRHPDDPQPRDPVWLWPAERMKGDMPQTTRAALVTKLARALAETGTDTEQPAS